jgi:putative glutamine amidotransferase
VSGPVIGVSCAIEQARWGVWDQPALIVPRSYALAIKDAGALALLLSPDEAVTADPDPLLDLLDGLIVSGGSDVDPGSYGAERHPETGPTRPERDAFEVALAQRAIERDIPLLGVCRGMHVLNVAHGGTLDQHIPERIGHEEHRHDPGSFSDHEVTLTPGSRAAEIAGGERVSVKSHHHQGLAQIGEGIDVTGWSVPDEVVEAIEVPECEFAVGVLWHPEEERPPALLGRFAERVARTREQAVGSGARGEPVEAQR